jgi:hypothetical protein
VFEDVKGCASQPSGVQKLGKRLFVDDAAARDVDQAGCRLHAGKLFTADQVAGLGGERNMQRQKVGARHHGVEIGQFDAALAGVFGGDIRVVGDHGHAKPLGTAHDLLGDAAEPNRAQEFAAHLDPHELVAFPKPSAHMGVGLGNIAGHGHQQGNGVFGCGHNIAGRRVDHHNAGLGCGVDVDVVDPDTRPSNDAQPGAGAQHLCRDLGGTANQQRIVGRDLCQQLRRAEVSFDIDLQIWGGAQRSQPDIRHAVADEDTKFVRHTEIFSQT